MLKLSMSKVRSFTALKPTASSILHADFGFLRPGVFTCASIALKRWMCVFENPTMGMGVGEAQSMDVANDDERVSGSDPVN